METLIFRLRTDKLIFRDSVPSPNFSCAFRTLSSAYAPLDTVAPYTGRLFHNQRPLSFSLEVHSGFPTTY